MTGPLSTGTPPMSPDTKQKPTLTLSRNRAQTIAKLLSFCATRSEFWACDRGHIVSVMWCPILGMLRPRLGDQPHPPTPLVAWPLRHLSEPQARTVLGVLLRVQHIGRAKLIQALRLASVLLARISTIVELRSITRLARRKDEINQTLRLSLTLLNHQTRITLTTTKRE